MKIDQPRTQRRVGHRSLARVLAFAAMLLIAGGGVQSGGILAQDASENANAKSDAKSDSGNEEQIREFSATSVNEARQRARILHETIHGTLQVMHRDFFRDDEGLKIPSHSLEDVFAELQRSYGVTLHWFSGDTKAMNIDHEAQGFEKQAVESFRSGKAYHEQFTQQRYQFAGKIRLRAVCLTCHLSRRSNNDDRFAGLSISMPLAAASPTEPSSAK